MTVFFTDALKWSFLKNIELVISSMMLLVEFFSPVTVSQKEEYCFLELLDFTRSSKEVLKRAHYAVLLNNSIIDINAIS